MWSAAKDLLVATGLMKEVILAMFVVVFWLIGRLAVAKVPLLSAQRSIMAFETHGFA